MERISDPERARRMARVLFSDMVAYAGDQIRIGLEKDDLFTRLKREIEQIRVFFERNVDPALPGAERIFNFALVDVLIARNRRVSTSIW
ncbi:MAG: hypothetical protein O7B23_05045 [Deltaproteobacteria bacterium]|nr:hypothetical protein [Myxococcales bacterium]MCZ6569512.1 hypothetical protein [Deltaproteobacteria bacterium]MCZ6713009.1 hypothetical protein [Deltaproteobacteria bacterium]MCZ6823982.1 hypothetical protein [Deltaproteobacteria bacterium]TDI99253.1 MAG: hypothetical protein E2O73_07805 [Deltaproteobacteria bacterium]